MLDPKVAARKLPAALEENQRSEEQSERADRLRLQVPTQTEVTGSLSLSPIAMSAMDRFEDFYLELRRQDRSLKRYQVMEALLRACEDEEVQAQTIARLRR